MKSIRGTAEDPKSNISAYVYVRIYRFQCYERKERKSGRRWEIKWKNFSAFSFFFISSAFLGSSRYTLAPRYSFKPRPCSRSFLSKEEETSRWFTCSTKEIRAKYVDPSRSLFAISSIDQKQISSQYFVRYGSVILSTVFFPGIARSSGRRSSVGGWGITSNSWLSESKNFEESTSFLMKANCRIYIFA